MIQHDIKKGHWKNIDLKSILFTTFGNVNEKDGKYITSFGAISQLIVWVEGGKLCVDTQMNKNVDADTASKTIKIYNQFLEETTGFTAKQRRNRMMKSMKGEGSKEV